MKLKKKIELKERKIERCLDFRWVNLLVFLAPALVFRKFRYAILEDMETMSSQVVLM